MTAESDEMQQSLATQTASPRQAMEAGALDEWIHRTLAARFDSTLEETLPSEWTGLLNGLH